jgi:hypothetical protein
LEPGERRVATHEQAVKEHADGPRVYLDLPDAMTLLDARPPEPPSAKRKFVALLILLAAVLGALLAHGLWDYPEERAVARFLETVEQGNYAEAYRLWKPSSSYSFDDFLRGWGEQGDYGKVREFKILDSKSKGLNTVVVTVRINNVDPPLELLVDRKTKGLAYSVF